MGSSKGSVSEMENKIVDFEEKKELSDKEMAEVVLGDLLGKLCADSITQDGKPITLKDYQEIILQDVYSLCDLLNIGSPELGK